MSLRWLKEVWPKTMNNFFSLNERYTHLQYAKIYFAIFQLSSLFEI